MSLRGRDGAAQFVDVKALLGTVWEKGDGGPDEFGQITMVERDSISGDVAHIATAGTGKRVIVHADELAREWRRIPTDVEVPEVALSSCVRCRRMNYGPCISATCIDLQVAPL